MAEKKTRKGNGTSDLFSATVVSGEGGGGPYMQAVGRRQRNEYVCRSKYSAIQQY